MIPNVSSSAEKIEIVPKKNLLFIGSMHEEKGAMVLVKAMALLKKNPPAINASIVFAHKNEEYFEKIKKEIEKNNLSNTIDFFENIPNNQLRQLIIPLHEIVVLPSLWPEPCSTVITEAMHSGKAIIASNVGGNKDLIDDGVNGLLFESGNEKELAEKIQEILHDKNLKNSIEHNSINSLKENFNWESIARKTINVYRTLLM